MLGLDAATLFEMPGLAAYVLVVTGLLGLVMGSFLNCWAWRMTHGESVLHGRSHCDTCGHVLGPADLVPVVSWVASRGRCRYCGAHISARCPVTELVCCAVYVSIVARYGLTPEALELLCFASALFVASLTDIDEYIIPNGCVVFALVVRLVYMVFAGYERALAVATDGASFGMAVLNQTIGYAKPYVLSALAIGIALIVLALIMDHVLGRDSLGGGDVKLLAVAALYVSWQRTLLLLLVACVLGIIVGVVQMGRASKDAADGVADQVDHGEGNGTAAAVEKPSSDEELSPDGGEPQSLEEDPRAFPWGPSIALATWFVLLFGQQIVNAYIGLFI